MSKKMKRIISIILAIVLCFSTSSVAFAAVEPTGNVFVTLSSDKKDYARGEKVIISTNINNGTESEQDVSITYSASGFVILDKIKDTVSVPAGDTKEIKQDAKAWRLIVAQQKHQNIIDGLMGYLWSALYTIFAMFSNNYEILKITVDDCPAVVLAKIDLAEKNESEKPTEPENPTKKHTVSFDLNYDNAVNTIPEQTIVDGNKAEEPDNPIRENYIFDGWYLQKDSTNAFDFNSLINDNIVLYAHWIEASTLKSEYTVTFVLNDDSNGAYEMQTVIANQKAKKPIDPEKESFIFTGWYTEPSTLNKFNFNTKIKEDIVLYAGWEINSSFGGDGAISSSSGGGTIFSITGIKVEDNIAITTINVNEMSALVVRFFDENTSEQIGVISTQTPEYCELVNVSMPITFDLPEYFKISADLYDGNGEKRCSTYICIDYTSAYAEFASQTIYSFPGKTVVNFDELTDNNFGVLNDDVIILEQTDTENSLTVSYSENEDIDEAYYTFTNTNAQFAELSVDDIVLAKDINGNICLFKIGNICENNDTYIITASTNEAELTEFYEVLKVDMKSSEDTVIATPKHNLLKAKSLAKSIEIINVDGDPIKGEISPINLDWTIYKSQDESKTVKLSGSISGSIAVDVKITYDVHIFGKDYFSISFTTDLEASGNVKLTASKKNDSSDYMQTKKEKTFSAPKLRIPTPIAGLTVSVKTGIPLELKAEGSAEFNLKFKNKNGFSYDSYSGRQDIDKKERTIELKAEGKLEAKIGPKVVVAVEFLETVVSAKIEAQAGAKGTATATLEIVDSETGDSKHACTLCVSIEAKWFVEASVKLEYYIVKDILEGEVFNIKILDLEGQILFQGFKNAYFSLIHSADSIFGSAVPHLGLGECPNKSYRTTIKLLDNTGAEISGTNITIKRENSSTTYNGTSSLTKYLYDGTYTIKTKINNTDISKRFVVSGGSQTIELRETAADGKINGKVLSAEDNNAVKDATIIISKDNFVVASLTSGNDGGYSVSLPDGTYLVKITKDNFIPFSQYVTVKDATESYLETTLMVSGDSSKRGGFSGTIRDAVTNNVVSDVRLDLRKGWDNYGYGEIVETIKTDSNGFFKHDITKIFNIIFGVESGYYTLKASKTGYADTYFNIIVLPGVVNENQNAIISPVASGNYRIVLTWGASPSDLDSHLTGYTASGSYDHIYYSRKSGYTGNLDRDDTNSYGPETITITDFDNLQNGFTYSVHDFSNKSSTSSSAMSNSGATVVLYRGDTLLETYHIPTNKVGTVWRVFSIDSNGVVQNLNEFYNQSDASSVS